MSTLTPPFLIGSYSILAGNNGSYSILAGNKDSYKTLDRFKIQQDPGQGLQS